MSGVSIENFPHFLMKGGEAMENLMMSIIAGVIASYIYDKLKSHSNATKSGWELSIKFRKNK